MNRKGFTLMELLLVVAVLAIVAAAAAPTFFGGAQEAMDEAKKASMMSAYQNTISGSNMLMAMAASKGITPTADVVPVKWSEDTEGSLTYYTPAAARVFTNAKGTSYIFSAKYDGTNKKIIITYGQGNADSAATTPVPEAENVTKTLENLWTTIKDAAATSGTNG